MEHMSRDAGPRHARAADRPEATRRWVLDRVVVPLLGQLIRAVTGVAVALITTRR